MGSSGINDIVERKVDLKTGDKKLISQTKDNL